MFNSSFSPKSLKNKQLGIPTANIPIEGLSVGGNSDLESGVYYGYAGVEIDQLGRWIGRGSKDGDGGGEGEGETEGKKDEREKGGIYPMVMSIGWNPFYKNTVRSVVCPPCSLPLTTSPPPFSQPQQSFPKVTPPTSFRKSTSFPPGPSPTISTARA